eukprot:COSAG05_NODE_702_length_7857_cov_37.135244_1_plen_87_part_10
MDESPEGAEDGAELDAGVAENRIDPAGMFAALMGVMTRVIVAVIPELVPICTCIMYGMSGPALKGEPAGIPIPPGEDPGEKGADARC